MTQTAERLEALPPAHMQPTGLTLVEVMEKYQTEYNFRSN